MGAQLRARARGEASLRGPSCLSASVAAAGEVGKINRVNEGPPTERGLAEYTPAGGKEARAPANSCAARLLAAEPPRLQAAVVESTHTVGAVRCSARRMRRRGGVVLAAKEQGWGADYLRRLIRDENVALRWSLGWRGVLDTIGGNPSLVRRGHVAVRPVNQPFFDRHPRSGVGVGGGKVFFVSVDGRQKGYSVGMTPQRFARLFVSLGARTALNLDGGGSTTMVVNGKVKNRPSDGTERPVSSALLLLRGADRRPSAAPQYSVRTSSEGPARAWAEAATDPASTGGLAAWLQGSGKRLPPALERAAESFSPAPTAERALEPGGMSTSRLRAR